MLIFRYLIYVFYLSFVITDAVTPSENPFVYAYIHIHLDN
jgi:hypothetical protein